MNQEYSISQYHFHPLLLLRTPVCNFSSYDGNHWEESLDDSLFRLAIRIASQSLYQELGKQEAGSWNNKRFQHSFWKYLNRMKFRPTPFGLFAGFTVIDWANKSGIILEDHGIMHIQPDFSTVVRENEALFSDNAAYYKLNPTIYPVMNTYRYLRYHNISSSGKRTCEVATVEKDEYIASLLEYCTQSFLREQIAAWISQRFEFNIEDCTQYISALISAQILIRESEVNICGADRLQYLPEQQNKGFTKQSVWIMLTKRKGNIPELPLEQMYINLERPVLSGTLDNHYQEPILNGMHCLQHLLPHLQPAGLEQFKTAFTKKYDRQHKLLIEVLDPEIGIGYHGLGNAQRTPALLRDVEVALSIDGKRPLEWTPVHALLLDKWNTSAPYAILQLEEKDISKLDSPKAALPNSCPVVFRITKEGLFIEQAGGATVTALLGRFTPLNVSVEMQAKQIAKEEEAANSSVAFAEISYISDLHTANIDRRESLYTFEIPVLCGSLLPEEQQIQLNDLWVAVEHNEIILWSKRLGRRIIPRLSSAFNYLRSDLPVFRFLCDLQHQGLRGNFSFDMEHFFPGLSFYPRICYKDAILHLAKWIITEKILRPVLSLPVAKQVPALRSLLEDLNLPYYISLDDYDNQLVFNLRNDTDMENLLALIKAKDTMVIREYIFHEEENIVTDTTGAGFIHQFIAVLQHDRLVYQDVPFPGAVRQRDNQRVLVPGSEWLYYKLYIHPIRSNELLKEYILPCIRGLKVQGLIKKWFFIRYADPEHHLRIRLHVHPKQAGFALQRFEKAMGELVSSGMIQSYHISTYERELERYTPELIEDCEDWFCAGTSLISEWVRLMPDDTSLVYYAVVLPAVNEMLKAFGYDYETAIFLFDRSFRGMYQQSPVDKKQVQDKSRELNRHVFMLQQERAAPLKKAFKKFCVQSSVLAGKANAVLSDARKEIFFMDLLHMHLNRLLVTDSFHQEMILYYALWKYYQSRLYFATKAS